MQFDSLADFLAMGGHGVYVWLAYGAALLVFAGSHLHLRAKQRSQIDRLRWTDRQVREER